MRRLRAVLLGFAAILASGGPARGDDPKPGGAPPAAPPSPARVSIPDPAPWLEIKGCSLVGVSRDGTVVAFLKREGDVVQLFRTDAEGSPPVLVTKRTEAVDLAVLSPDGSKAVVGYDKDGDENDGLHLVDVTGESAGRERVLVAPPGVQHGSVVWSKEGDRIFYRSNADNGTDFHLYEMTVADAKARKVLDVPGMWNVQDVAAGGNRLLVGLTRSGYDASVHALDLPSGRLVEVDPAPRGTTAAQGNARFLGGGRGAIYTTDAAGEYHVAKVAFLDDGRTLPIDTRTAGDVEALHVVDDESSGYLVENRKGLDRVVAVDIGRRGTFGPSRDPRRQPPEIGGLWGRIDSDAAGRLYYTFSEPMRPTVIQRWDPATGHLRRVASYDLAGLAPDALPEPPRVVQIPTPDGTTVPAWRYLPQPGTRKGLPFLVSVHGGPEGQARPSFHGEHAYLLSLGFGILAPNVRGSTGYGKAYRDADNYRKRMDSVRDVKACADWLVKEGWADPKRIGIMGGSYGGFMVLACLTEYPDAFAAGVEAVGIANFETFLERTAPYRRAHREAEYGPLSDREFLRSISPIHKVDRIVAPLLIAHGEQDPRVPVHEARQMEEALRRLGRPVEALYFPDEGHGWQKKSNRLTYIRTVAEFLVRHLKP
jgi:dipeptidyl aminopeptidase/acylaminoacyl peptidase